MKSKNENSDLIPGYTGMCKSVVCAVVSHGCNILKLSSLY